MFNVNGASRSSNNTRIDGVSTTNVWLPHVAAYVPALESLETVNVVTNSFDAEQGLAGGSAINVQIKSGTNKVAGSAFEYYTNEKLRTQNYFDPPGTQKGKWRYHQFGGTLGGPVVRNKLFYFASYENTRDQRNVSKTVSVPTEPLRRGDLSASPTLIYDPMTGNPDGSARMPFPGNIIPSGRIDPIAQKIIALMPLPNVRGPDGQFLETRNYFVQAPFTESRLGSISALKLMKRASGRSLKVPASRPSAWTHCGASAWRPTASVLSTRSCHRNHAGPAGHIGSALQCCQNAAADGSAAVAR